MKPGYSGGGVLEMTGQIGVVLGQITGEMGQMAVLVCQPIAELHNILTGDVRWDEDKTSF